MKKFFHSIGLSSWQRLAALLILVMAPLPTLWAGPSETAPPPEKKREAAPREAALVYEIQGVEVSVPMSGKGMDAMHETGVTLAQKEGLHRLFRRMLTSKDRVAHKDFLATLHKESKRLTERVMVRAEKQHADRLAMTVNVLFSQKEITAAFVQQGLPYNEAAHPLVLLLAKEESSMPGIPTPGLLLQQALLPAAREYGFSVLLPLGDMEDLTNLSWERAAKGDKELLNWAAARYGATNTWGVQAEEAPVTVKSGPPRFRVSGSLLESRPNSAVVTWKAREEKSGATQEEVTPALYAPLATKLLQQVMDRWIQDHSLQPGLQHQVHLRVIHEAQLARLTEFLKELRNVPGVKEPQVVNTSARETVFEFAFQGQDDALLAALGKLVVHQERTADQIAVWLISPPPANTTLTPTPAPGAVPAPTPGSVQPQGHPTPGGAVPATPTPGSVQPQGTPTGKTPDISVPNDPTPEATPSKGWI
ncbi:MAG: DUF2066 domain-containing protein [Magnetococcus sp. YQC-5]